jgi:hypothetical protein
MDDTKYYNPRHVLLKRHHIIDSSGISGVWHNRGGGDEYFCHPTVERKP